jgi:hypothetical protein
MTNPILKELYDIRREILAEHRDDLADHLRTELARTKASGHPVAKIKQRSIQYTGTAESGKSSVENHSLLSGERECSPDNSPLAIER